jgi:hypothetical protein
VQNILDNERTFETISAATGLVALALFGPVRCPSLFKERELIKESGTAMKSSQGGKNLVVTFYFDHTAIVVVMVVAVL